MLTIKSLSPSDLKDDFLTDFHHEQRINAKWEKRNETWVRAEADILREWDAEKRKWIPFYLREQIGRGGFVLGAFCDGRLAGFSGLDGILAEKHGWTPEQGIHTPSYGALQRAVSMRRKSYLSL